VLIFLDIDGVLNTHEQNRAGSSGLARCHPVDRQCVSHLAHIIDETGASCVLTSSWRYRITNDSGLEAFEFMLRTHGFPESALIGYTCRDEEISMRGRQIRAWIERENLIAPYVVIDDLDPSQEFMGFHPLVTTNCHVGLTREDAEEAIRLLRFQVDQPWRRSLILSA
jgi:hypothetical protein